MEAISEYYQYPNHRLLSNPFITNSTSSNNDSGGQPSQLPFLSYLVLLLCCVVPTCVACKRRQLRNARYSQRQQQSGGIHPRPNLTAWYQEHSRFHYFYSPEGQEERKKWLTEVLEATTFVSTTCVFIDTREGSGYFHPRYFTNLQFSIVFFNIETINLSRRPKKKTFSFLALTKWHLLVRD